MTRKNSVPKMGKNVPLPLDQVITVFRKKFTEMGVIDQGSLLKDLLLEWSKNYDVEMQKLKAHDCQIQDLYNQLIRK